MEWAGDQASVVRHQHFQTTSYEAVRQIVLKITHVASTGGTTHVPCTDQIRTLATMTTYASHRFIVVKVEIAIFAVSLEMVVLYFCRIVIT